MASLGIDPYGMIPSRKVVTHSDGGTIYITVTNGDTGGPALLTEEEMKRGILPVEGAARPANPIQARVTATMSSW